MKATDNPDAMVRVKPDVLRQIVHAHELRRSDFSLLVMSAPGRGPTYCFRDGLFVCAKF